MSRAADARGATRALDELLGAVADHQGGPAGGWSAAAAVGLGAALAAMAVRASRDELADHEALLERAEGLRARAAGLADADVAAYRAVLDAGGGQAATDSPGRTAVAAALAQAADVPLAVAETGADAAALAADLATRGRPPLRADAWTGAVLAEAGARAAAELVAVNTAAGGLGGHRPERARTHAARAAAQLTGGAAGDEHNAYWLEGRAPSGARGK